MNIVVVHNPSAGSALPQSELTTLFATAGITVDAYLDITNDTMKDRIADHAKNGEVIAAIGGDGTIAHTADRILGTPGVLAPLPGGTLNHFTKDVGVPQDLKEAIQRLPEARRRKIDVATVNTRVFLNNSSIGIYPSSLRTRARFEDKFGKWPAAVIGSIRAFIRFRLYSVTVNGQEFQTPFLFVGNNKYDIDQAGQRTNLTSGVLSIYAITSHKRSALIKLLFAALVGRATKQQELITYETTHFVVHTKKAFVSVSTDGEVQRVNTPLVYTLHPTSLTII